MTFLENPTVQSITDVVRVQSGLAVLWIGEDAAVDLDELVKAMQVYSVPFMGGIVPRVIHGDKTYSAGCAIVSFDGALTLLCRPSHDPDWKLKIGRLLDETPKGCSTTFVILGDAFSKNIFTALEALYDQYGTLVSYFGAGCGRSSLASDRTVFTRDGVAADAVAIGVAHMAYKGMSRHGLVPWRGPLVATGVEGPVVTHLNWRPAMEVYSEVLAEAGVHFPEGASRAEFRLVATKFPFGQYREGLSYLVREPFEVTEEGGIICAGQVSKQSVLQIMRHTESTKEEVQLGAAHLNRSTMAFTVTCESRESLICDQFSKEIQAINDVTQQTNCGVTAFGEISSTLGSLEFLNKTAVFSCFHENEQ